MSSVKEQILIELGTNPLLAHRALFKHRHPEATQHFHDIIIQDWHSEKMRVLDIVFRGGGKSTIAEEAVVVMACLQQFNNCLVIGETETRAQERLASIKYEIENNEDIKELFGDLKGNKWQETYIELSTGPVLRAHGRGQSLRGVKHLHYRPDLVFLDDIEDDESVKTPELRRKTMEWFVKTFLPALEPGARVRMAATPLHPQALAMVLSESSDWLVRKFPILYIDGQGNEVATWPERYSLEWCQNKRKEYAALGQTQAWMQEYMCQAENPADKVFTPDMFKYEPTIHTWQPVYVVYDPARTTKQTSAMTGKVVGSWVNNRLLVWEASGHFWKPDEIINDIFITDEKYTPVSIGVEEDGLCEFIMQPLRHAQVARAHTIPIVPLKAPKGKIDFIKSVQPFFKAGEVIFTGESTLFKELESQLLGFPTGRIDIPNALAYFLKLRPGMPIYDLFGVGHIDASITCKKRYPLYFCVNTNKAYTTGVLVQVYEGQLLIISDYFREGDAGTILKDIVREAAVTVQRDFEVVVPQRHFQQYDTSGLVPAARHIPIDISSGRSEVSGREEIRKMMQQLTNNGVPQFRVAPKATWTLRALSGGYAREVGKDIPIDNPYKVLCEGLESFAGMFTSFLNTRSDEGIRYDTTADGRQYISSLPRRQ